MLRSIRFPLICLLALAACNGVNKTAKVPVKEEMQPQSKQLLPKKNTLLELDSSLTSAVKKLNDPPYKAIVVFDGSCSFCIAQFLNVLKDLRTKKAGLPCIYVSISNDLHLINYYLKESGLELTNDEILIKDAKRSVLLNNHLPPDESMTFLLVNHKNEIVELGNPFQSKESHKVYSDLGLL